MPASTRASQTVSTETFPKGNQPTHPHGDPTHMMPSTRNPQLEYFSSEEVGHVIKHSPSAFLAKDPSRQDISKAIGNFEREAMALQDTHLPLARAYLKVWYTLPHGGMVGGLTPCPCARLRFLAPTHHQIVQPSASLLQAGFRPVSDPVSSF